MFQIKLFSSLLLGWFLYTVSDFNTHEYYVSSTDVVYVIKNKHIQITTRIFIDDIEAYFNSRSNSKIQLQPDLNEDQIDSLTQVFFNKNFNLIFDNKELKINYLGRKYKEDQLLIFAEALAIDKPSSFEVNNTILTPFRKGQQNIVHFKAENFKKSFLMDASKTILTELWNH